MDQTFEVDDCRSILLSFDRVWPSYVVTWSVRQQQGESDFPLANGTVESLPPKDGTLDEMWDRLRKQAKTAAYAAVPAQESSPRRGFFSRLFRQG